MWTVAYTYCKGHGWHSTDKEWQATEGAHNGHDNRENK